MSSGFTDLNARASHSCGIHHGHPFSVFAKLGSAAEATGQFAAELAGLRLLRARARVGTPEPVAGGIVAVPGRSLLLFEALPERIGRSRTSEDFRAIGRTLAAVHQAHDEQFGLAEFDGFFGPVPQDNQPVPGGSWADFYAQRRILPLLALAAHSGKLPPELVAGVERILQRLPGLCGPEPLPSLLHGDAQQNNFVATTAGTVLIDACPYFGNPELDLALLDFFEPIPADVFDAYNDVSPVDPGFAGRRELWRIHAYLAVVALDGDGVSDRPFLRRLADAVRYYA